MIKSIFRYTSICSKGENMDFPREKLLEKYVQIYEQRVAPYTPDFEVADGTTRYIRFNDAWQGMDPFAKFLISRLTNRKNTFPKTPSAKIAKNANPANYVTLRYDSEGKLKMARLGDTGVDAIIISGNRRPLRTMVTYRKKPFLIWRRTGYVWLKLHLE